LPTIGVSQLTPAQEAKVDSLNLGIEEAKHDTVIVKNWVELIKIVFAQNRALSSKLTSNIDSLCRIRLNETNPPRTKHVYLESQAFSLNVFGILSAQNGDIEAAILSWEKCLKTEEEIGNDKGMARTLENLASVFASQGKNDKALVYYSKSLRIKEKLGADLARIHTLIQIGTVFKDQGDFGEAITNYTQALKISEKLNNENGVANSLNSIGNVYLDQKDYNKALDYYTRSLNIKKKLKNINGLDNALNNIGLVHEYMGDYEKALDFYQESIILMVQNNNKIGHSMVLNNIGNIYLNQNNYKKALEYQTKSLQLKEELGDKKGIATSYLNIAAIYNQQGIFSKALEYNSKALALAKESKAIKVIEGSARELWELYKDLGRYEESMTMYELYISTRDSIESEENQKAVIRQEYKYEYEKQAAEDSIKTAEADKVKDAQLLAEKAENKRHELEAKQQKEQKMYLYGGLALALLFGGFIFNRFRVTSKQKNIIEEQKIKVDEAFDELEEKNTEILDSINYAKRIQSAILPPTKLVKEYLKQSFILYKPKDIVAGDFYWLEPTENGILFAAADCTGHGVPGAMVSVVCNNGLNRSVREYGLTEPGDILGKTREIVISEFEKSEEDVKDGMDIALVSLQGSTLKYAGAHNPLWIIRKGDSEIQEIKANKQPIGKYDDPKPYTTHTIELNGGDSFYIFSDGYADQFGGERAKKFKTANFKRLLLSIQNESMERQKELIDDAFEAWKGQLEQLDDVCVIGLRI
jgi:serine phosphatase RsbU (regulator of sigma subunit)/Tfp pilus assembly protein PilF